MGGCQGAPRAAKILQLWLLIGALTALSGCLSRSLPEDEATQSAHRLAQEANAWGQGNPACEPWAAVDASALREQLQERMSGQRVPGYGPVRDHMFGRKEPTWDLHEGQVECVYTGRRATLDGTRTPEDTNTEHSWPRSLGAGDDPARSDLHHLFVTDRQANGRRSNYPYGEADCGEGRDRACLWEVGGSKLGLSKNSQIVFEVRPQSRGNIARAQFYFAVRYGMQIAPDSEDALRRWHREDPVDAAERARNEGIFQVQGNRNFFIDCPALVDQILDF